MAGRKGHFLSFLTRPRIPLTVESPHSGMAAVCQAQVGLMGSIMQHLPHPGLTLSCCKGAVCPVAAQAWAAVPKPLNSYTCKTSLTVSSAVFMGVLFKPEIWKSLRLL
jgi:hypothetical protein